MLHLSVPRLVIPPDCFRLESTARLLLTIALSALAMVPIVVQPRFATAAIAQFLPFATGTNPSSDATGDLDHDGKPELGVAHHGSYAPPHHGRVSVFPAARHGTVASRRDY